MAVELVVPSVGESITQVEIGDWLKPPGEVANQDDPGVVIETDKVTVELPAPATGTITKMLKKKGDKAAVGDVIGYMEVNGAAKREADRPKPKEMTRGGVEQENKSVDQHHPSRDSVPTSPSSAEEGSLGAKKPPVVEKAPTGREQQIVPMTPIRRRI